VVDRLTPYVAISALGLFYSLLASALWPIAALIIPEYQLGTAYGLMQVHSSIFILEYLNSLCICNVFPTVLHNVADLGSWAFFTTGFQIQPMSLVTIFRVKILQFFCQLTRIFL
jgi:hypothetical protein